MLREDRCSSLHIPSDLVERKSQSCGYNLVPNLANGGIQVSERFFREQRCLFVGTYHRIWYDGRRIRRGIAWYHAWLPAEYK